MSVAGIMGHTSYELRGTQHDSSDLKLDTKDGLGM
jgi:hypothetical protein